MEKNIRMVAMDLDGTLLTDDKQLSEGNRKTLELAAANGIEIVPATGRMYIGMPEVIRSLPFVHYVIETNGAAVLDVRTGECLVSEEIPAERAVEVLNFVEKYPVAYDCYIGEWGYMNSSMLETADTFAPSPAYLELIRTLRSPVENLKEYILDGGKAVKKLQVYSRKDELLSLLRTEIQKEFPDIAVTSSVKGNLELNDNKARKGDVLLRLAQKIGIPPEETMGIGDGLNDVNMIQRAGIGVAMKNGADVVKEAADYITHEDNNHDGVSEAIRKFCRLDLI